MQRRGFITILGGAAAWPLMARAQGAMPVIGFLSTLQSIANEAAFRRGLAEEGYVEGKNIAVEKRFTNFRPELLKEAAGDLVRLEVNVIFASHPEAVAAARNATSRVTTGPTAPLERVACDCVSSLATLRNHLKNNGGVSFSVY
jgi:putative ABC transport system substrate-binding protein